MRSFAHYAFGIGAASVFLAGCGSPSPVAAPGGMPFSTARTQSVLAGKMGNATGKVEFAYVANDGSDNVSAYAVNTGTGALTQVPGSPFAAGYGPYGVAIDPAGKYIYVANNGADSGKPGNVSGFAIDPQSGALTTVPGSPFTAGTNPIGITISPTGKFVYVVNYNSRDVSVFAVSARTGALKQIQGSPYRTRPTPTAEAIDPTGEFLYVMHSNIAYPYLLPGHIEGYAVDPRSGALRKLKGAELATGSFPDSAAFDPSGKFVYVAAYASEWVSAYAIKMRTGALRVVEGSPFRAGNNPVGVAIDPRGTFAYVPAGLGVYGYTIAPNGALTPVPGSPFAAGNVPNGAAVDPLGRFVYVSNRGTYSKVYAYNINRSTGALTQVSGSPFAAGSGPAGIATCEVENDRCVPAIL